jgi:peroxiredoxin
MAAARSLVVALVLGPLVALLGGLGARPCDAEGATLTGLLAPELTFPTGLNGIERGQTLSAYRGKVVWLKFWLRDCPRCRKTLPLAQELHELYGKSGLVVLTVVHQFAPDQVRPFLEKEGYTFPVACDPTGALAQAYQVNHRPTDYVIGVDGRVKVSNNGPEDVLRRAGPLPGRGVGRVPAGLESARDEVRAWRYDRPSSRRAAAAAAEAPAEVRDFAARLSRPGDARSTRMWSGERPAATQEAGQARLLLGVGDRSCRHRAGGQGGGSLGGVPGGRRGVGPLLRARRAAAVHAAGWQPRGAATRHPPPSPPMT